MVAGGSPMASAISRCACAKRVSESISSSTLLAAIAEIFGDRGREPGAVQAHQRRIVGGRRHDDRAPHAVGPESVADEFLDLAAALADQADDDDVGIRVARHHAEQHALADADAGEQADALSAADREQRVDGAHADIQRIADRRGASADSAALRSASRARRSADRRGRRAVGRRRRARGPAGRRRPARPSTVRVGITRAPGFNPRMSPVGIRNSLSPEKPTTSASTCLPSAVSTRQRPPTAASQPTASKVMPTMRFSVPSTTMLPGSAKRSRACAREAAQSFGRGRSSAFRITARRRCAPPSARAPCRAVRSRSRRAASRDVHRSAMSRS